MCKLLLPLDQTLATAPELMAPSERSFQPFSSIQALDGARSSSRLRGCSVRLQEKQRVGFGRENAACTLNSHSETKGRSCFWALRSQAKPCQKIEARSWGEGVGSTQEGRVGITHFTVNSQRMESIPFSFLKAKVLQGRKEPHTLAGSKKHPPAICPLHAPSMTSMASLPGSVCLCNKNELAVPAKECTHLTVSCLSFFVIAVVHALVIFFVLPRRAPRNGFVSPAATPDLRK